MLLGLLGVLGIFCILCLLCLLGLLGLGAGAWGIGSTSNTYNSIRNTSGGASVSIQPDTAQAGCNSNGTKQRANGKQTTDTHIAILKKLNVHG